MEELEPENRAFAAALAFCTFSVALTMLTWRFIAAILRSVALMLRLSWFTPVSY